MTAYAYRQLKSHIELYQKHLLPYFPNGIPEDITLFPLLGLFQHYGIATPLIDFTLSAETALYFAFSDLFSYGVKTIIPPAPNRGYITIVEVRTDLLMNTGMLRHVDERDNTIEYFLRYNDFYYYKPGYVPLNGNLERQQGVFLYLDSELSLERYLTDQIRFNRIAFDKKPVVWHLIPYSSLTHDCSDEQTQSLFAFLLSKEKLGVYLYDDIRGIERDMKNQAISMACIAKKGKCKCLQRLVNTSLSE